MITNSLGKDIDIFNLKPEDIDIRNIAHNLSLKYRFNCCCKRFYSVAEHSILASYRSDDPLLSMYLLLHDAAEAYLPDFPGPDKSHYYIHDVHNRYCISVINQEKLILKTIFRALTLDYKKYLLYVSNIHEIDCRLRATEARDLMPKQICDAKPYDSKIIPVCPENAEMCFILRFNELNTYPEH